MTMKKFQKQKNKLMVGYSSLKNYTGNPWT